MNKQILPKSGECLTSAFGAAVEQFYNETEGEEPFQKL